MNADHTSDTEIRCIMHHPWGFVKLCTDRFVVDLRKDFVLKATRRGIVHEIQAENLEVGDDVHYV